LPITFFAIIIVNFGIINLAPGDPVTITEINQEGNATMKADRATAFGGDERYLHFREHYGLTLPLFFNVWPWTLLEQTKQWLEELVYRKPSTTNPNSLSVKEYDELRIHVGDRSRFMMENLFKIIESEKNKNIGVKQMAIRFFVRGASREPILGGNLSEEQKNLQ